MNLGELIVASHRIDPELVVYAKTIDGHFVPSSEVSLLDLSEKERDLTTHEVASLRCPGFSYGMEMFLIQEFIEDLDSVTEKMEMSKKIDRVIYYIEYDA